MPHTCSMYENNPDLANVNAGLSVGNNTSKVYNHTTITSHNSVLLPAMGRCYLLGGLLRPLLSFIPPCLSRPNPSKTPEYHLHCIRYKQVELIVSNYNVLHQLYNRYLYSYLTLSDNRQ